MENNEHIFTIWFRENNKTRVEIAKKIGMHNSYFTHIEKGRQLPSVCMALKMEVVMGIPAIKILGLG
jgi:transcriptional regulator with XRE-family HTH domain